MSLKSLLKTKYTGCPYEGLSDNGTLWDRKWIQLWKTLVLGNILVSMSYIMKLRIAGKLKLYKLDEFIKNINFNFGTARIQFQIRMRFGRNLWLNKSPIKVIPSSSYNIYFILWFLENFVKMNQLCHRSYHVNWIKWRVDIYISVKFIQAKKSIWSELLMQFVLGFHFDIFPVSLKQLRLPGLVPFTASCTRLTNKNYSLMVTVAGKLLTIYNASP